MPEFKQNHEVPRSLIANWRSTLSRGERVWVFDIRRQKIYLSPSTGVSAFKFAIVPNRYVVQLPQRRATDVERWLASGETAVTALARGLDLQISQPLDHEEAIPLVYGLVGLGFRSAHVLEFWFRGLQDPAVQTRVGRFPKTKDEVKKLVLENLVNLVDRRVQRLLPPRFEVLRGLGSDILLADQPALVPDEDAAELYVPIAPRTLVCVSRGHTSTISVTDASPATSRSLVETANDLIVQGARRWVVARMREHLEDVAPRLTKEAVAQRVSEREQVAVAPLTERDRWWVIGDLRE